ncbi:hypothetical protein QN389_17840, partial [Pseudomonas sp. CCC4.4]|nr:hypothetical protein [Pseudomonas sp. CCC4.4]
MKTNRIVTCIFSLWLVACAEQQLDVSPERRGTFNELQQEQKPQAIKGVQPPADVLEAMNRNYGESQNNCREYGTSLPRGHYYCSGVLLRTVDDGNFDPWTYSPSSIALGATSYSWIRQDISNKTLYHPAGLILRNKAEGNSHGLQALDTGFICLYPFDAGTLANPNNHQGCGVRRVKQTPTLNDTPLQREVQT